MTLLCGRMKDLLFWITYKRCSGSLIILRQIPSQVDARKRWCSWEFPYCSVSTEGHMCCSTCWWHGSVLSSLCQGFHCQTGASWCQLWSMQDMPYIWSAAMNQCLHIFQGVQWYRTFSHLSWEVGAAVTLMESMMAEVAQFNSVEQHITAANKNSIDFEWIRCALCSLHHQQVMDGIARSLTRIYIPRWCRREIGWWVMPGLLSPTYVASNDDHVTTWFR
jgi:hypothetical protein